MSPFAVLHVDSFHLIQATIIICLDLYNSLLSHLLSFILAPTSIIYSPQSRWTPHKAKVGWLPMTLRVSASFQRVASSGREKGRERGLAPVHLSFYLKALHPAVETRLIWVPLPLNSLASANIFQREIKFPFRLKCKIEFGLSPKKDKLQAKLVKIFCPL